VHTAIVALPVFLLILPADFFDSGQTVCLSVLLFNVQCYGCGMTRALMHLLHLDFSGAWAFNPLSYLALPALFWLWMQSVQYLNWHRTIRGWLVRSNRNAPDKP
jgi:hypothetical protein